jgi:hypothetical protein
LWKIVENVDGFGAGRDSAILSACSACAGDYEDPDRTTPPIYSAEELADDGDCADEDRRGGVARAEGFLNGERMPEE